MAIDSVLAQNYADFEIVIVDDGSTDGSADVVRSIIDPRIKLISTENKGVSAARNTGINYSTSDYIAFLDADDMWHPDYLLELRRLIEDFPQAGIYGFSNLVVCDSFESVDMHGFPEGFRGVIENVWEKGVPYWTSASAVSRLALDKVGLFDERMAYGEDMDMWWRILLEFDGVYFASPLVVYRQDAENRAMNKAIPFEKHIPFFIEKYDSAREADKRFRFFADREFLYRLFQYTGNKKYKEDLNRVISKIDFSIQKKSMRLRFLFPKFYRLYIKIVGR